ncbi:MAG TPA: T9SS type A sorting domain-containing protein [Chitinophagaceae bacterium]|nr:T9SS type A sorting domain-containing protein [Chitinophagaceae bacterium]
MKNLIRSAFIVLALAGAVSAKSQVPVLSSYPSANGVVFLDFDGHTVSGTSWNTSGPIVCGASGLNNSQIQTVFDRIAEDYRPFDVNVTTDSTKYLAAPANKRIRVIVTVSSSWYGSAGGVAFVGSFTWGDDTPCFVFSALLNYNVKNIAEAAAHEAGHTLGLYHQATYDANCIKTSDYNYGTGTGEIGWAPIMGVGYGQNFTLWNNGPNSFGCNSLQSDLTVLTTSNGFTYRTDDHASTFGGATTASFANNEFNVSGIVERNTDQDMIKFVQPTVGSFQLSAVPYNVGTNNSGSDLDMQVTLYNSSQTQLNVYNPGALLSSVIDTTLMPGTYYLKIEGKGNLYAPNYASLGSYSLHGITQGIPLALRKLELHGSLNGDKHQLNWLIDADEQVISQVLEVAIDGRNFNPVTQPAVSDRSYSYRPSFTSAGQYRLNVTFDNGRQYYSNVATIKSINSVPRPQLISNIIQSEAIRVSSPGNYDYSIFDFNGKTLSHGRLVTGTNQLESDRMSNGMYLILFSNGSEQWTEKFVKQ